MTDAAVGVEVEVGVMSVGARAQIGVGGGGLGVVGVGRDAHDDVVLDVSGYPLFGFSEGAEGVLLVCMPGGSVLATLNCTVPQLRC